MKAMYQYRYRLGADEQTNTSGMLSDNTDSGSTIEILSSGKQSSDFWAGDAEKLAVSATYSDESIRELLFMIEEEKMAGDIYAAFYDMYGLNIFSNIAASEDQHFDALINQAKNIGLDVDQFIYEDSGTFADAELQEMYDTLLTQGSLSLTNALEVGAAIEEKDMVDIAAAADAVEGTSLASVYDNLLNGSANHLEAFQGALLENATSDTSVAQDGLDINGTSGADVLQGDIHNDTLLAGDGMDTITGGDGDDFLVGGSTDADLRDNIYGGNGDDSLDGGYGNDELRGDAGNDTLTGGFGADTMIGGSENDVLNGQAWGDLLFGGSGDDFINGGFGFDRVNGGDGADMFFHLGIADHGSDWVQDYDASEGDILQYGDTGATLDQFQVNFSETADAGEAGIDEGFVIYRPSGQILWALVDGAAQDSINIMIGSETYDLLS